MKILLTLNFSGENEQKSHKNDDNSENTKELTSKGGGIKLDKDFYDKIDLASEYTDSIVGEQNQEDLEGVEGEKVYLGDFWKNYYGKDSNRVAKDVLNARIGAIVGSNWASDELKAQANTIKSNVEQGRQDVYGALSTVPIINKNEQVLKEYLTPFNRYTQRRLSNEGMDSKAKEGKLSGNILRLRHPEYYSCYEPSNHTVYLRSGGEPSESNDQFNFYNGVVNPETDKINISELPEAGVEAHEYSHALNPDSGIEFESPMMYLADGGAEQLGQMGSFKRSAFKQGLGEIKTPEDFKSVVSQLKIDKNGVGYWPSGEKVDTETQRFLNTGRQLDWDFILQMMYDDPEIWKKVGMQNRNVNQLLRRNYSNFQKQGKMRTV